MGGCPLCRAQTCPGRACFGLGIAGVSQRRGMAQRWCFALHIAYLCKKQARQWQSLSGQPTVAPRDPRCGGRRCRCQYFTKRAWLSTAWVHAWEWTAHAHRPTRATTAAVTAAQALSVCPVPLPCAHLQPLRPRPALLQRRVLAPGQKLRPARCRQTLPGQPQGPPRPCPTPGAMEGPSADSDASG